jgi:mannose-6-phosphate isomerase-like protein (cupin superfamily)
MTQLHEVTTAPRPYALGAEEGERIWFLNGEMTFKATAALTGGDLCLTEVRAPSGYATPLHVHHDEHEGFYVLEGAIDVVCGDERYRAGAGSFAFLPIGIAHAFRVASEEPVRMLAIGVPGGMENFFRDLGREPEGPGLPEPAPVDIARVTEVGARHNEEVVGPPPFAP